MESVYLYNYQKYVHLLKGEYKNTFEQIELYFNYGNDMDTSVEIIEEVLDLLLSAQADGKDVHMIIGDDIESFCKEMEKGYKKPLLEKGLKFGFGLRYVLFILGVFEVFSLIFDILNNVKNPLNVEVEIASSYLLVAVLFFAFYIIDKISRKLIFTCRWYTKKIRNIILVIFFIIYLLSAFIIPEDFYWFAFLPRYLYIPLTLGLGGYLIIRKRMIKKRNIIQKKEISFDQTVYHENIKSYQKKYEKYVKKCEEKNTNPLDVKTWYNQRGKRDIKYDYLTDVIMILIVLVFVLNVASESELSDSLFFCSHYILN